MCSHRLYYSKTGPDGSSKFIGVLRHSRSLDVICVVIPYLEVVLLRGASHVVERDNDYFKLGSDDIRLFFEFLVVSFWSGNPLERTG